MKKWTAFTLLLIFPLLSSAAFNELEESPLSTQMQEYGENFFVPGPPSEDPAGEETQGTLPSPESIEQTLKTLGDFNILLRFSQTKWNECAENPSGNYLTYRCVSSRPVSEILNSYLEKHLLACTDEALEAQGGGHAQSLHLVHAGITADPRHSPKSLHSENRAIDIKVMKVRLTNGMDRQFTYALAGNRPFYTALRKCWGERVNRYNGCPVVSGGVGQTGSIGWENKDHGHHMHLSVPYCVNGRYGSGLFQR